MNDTFSVRFDNGFETCPRIELWDPGSASAVVGEGVCVGEPCKFLLVNKVSIARNKDVVVIVNF